jgi:class 3 adenylate cyclase
VSLLLADLLSYCSSLSQFKSFAKDLIDSVELKAHTKFDVLNSLSTTITSYTLSTGMTWPFVSIPHFDIRADEARKLIHSELLAFAPIVSKDERTLWEDFAAKSRGSIQDGLEFETLGEVSSGMTTEKIHHFSKETEMIQDNDMLVPLWQIGQVPTNASIVMMNLFTHPSFKRMIIDVLEIEHTLISEELDLEFLLEFSTGTIEGQVRSFSLTPVFDTFDEDAEVVGFLVAVVPWLDYFEDVLPEGTNGLAVDVKDTCGSAFTYTIYGHEAEYEGQGSLHDPKFDYISLSSEFAEFARYDGEVSSSTKHCEYTLEVYPSIEYRKSFDSHEPVLFASVVVLVFLFTTLVFVIYDTMVRRRQHKVLETAQRTAAIVTSLFPKEVGKRMLKEAEEQHEQFGRAKKDAAKNQLKSFLANSEGSQQMGGVTTFKSKPIAELFPEVTIMFADIVGFTAWSSTREPTQVFTLLETIYAGFDEIARRRGVFKVETVGDCYVAVAGLPDPRNDHHVVMARFARDCLYKFRTMTRELEVTLGPDTTDLGLRVGLHSGPVTAGVLRGDRARFQLFGDTMNTTARVETSGMANKIHISHETAELLQMSGKGHWATPREEKVVAKGKGEMQTYFLGLKGTSAMSTSSGGSSDTGSCRGSLVDDETKSSNKFVSQERKSTDQDRASEEQVAMAVSGEKQRRLIDWNAEVLTPLLREMVALREASGIEATPEAELKTLESAKLRSENSVIEEVQEIVTLPVFNADNAKKMKDPELVDLGDEVIAQLTEYVTVVSAMYRSNPFHNFEHASHVITSTVKLLSRISAPDLRHGDDEADAEKNLHDLTYGITSDPLTQFACIFAALIHDADHPGVPNGQLIIEKASIAAAYREKSIAEQNSVDLAWELLMDETFIDLRRCIYQTESEFKRFRELVVNAVMATDIMDKDLKALRNGRWEKAFNGDQEEDAQKAVNRKATIVIEHLIQASDVAHTMQHWHIYRKWNARLFEEMYKAYSEGRAEKDPSDFWYKGEMGFFDFYIIPLAKKLKDCGVFGVSSYEYLNYAEKNRREWEIKGQEIVAEMVQSIKSERPRLLPRTDRGGLSVVPDQRSVSANVA